MSNLIESLAQDRNAARYRSATHTSPATTAATARDSLNAESSSSQSTRSRAGWLLIGLGLRLVTRGGDTPARRARLIGQ
jgi:hypothetical protein